MVGETSQTAPSLPSRRELLDSRACTTHNILHRYEFVPTGLEEPYNILQPVFRYLTWDLGPQNEFDHPLDPSKRKASFSEKTINSERPILNKERTWWKRDKNLIVVWLERIWEKSSYRTIILCKVIGILIPEQRTPNVYSDEDLGPRQLGLEICDMRALHERNIKQQ